MGSGIRRNNIAGTKARTTVLTMIDETSLDAFLAQSVRAVRAGEIAHWTIVKNGDLEGLLAALWDRIEFHGIAVLLHQAAENLKDWPASLMERIAEEARLSSLWEATHQMCLTPLLKALSEAGHESILMKGTALAYSLYDDPATRRRGDSDLLIQPEALEQTRQYLLDLGWYRRNDPHGLNFQETWLHSFAGEFVHSVDLHWEPSDRPAIQRVLTRNDFFGNKKALERLSPEAFGPDPAICIIHGAINQNWHETYGYFTERGRVTGSRRLIWSVDFDLLANALDSEGWERLNRFSKERQIGPLVADALRDVHADLGTGVPEGLLADLRSTPLHPDVVRYLEATDSLSQFLSDLRSARDWKFRLTILRDRAFPPRSHLLEKYPNRGAWPTVVLRGRLVGETAVRLLRRVVLR